MSGHAATIQRVLGEFYVPHREYHQALPPELAEWYCYGTGGAGHSICCVLSADFQPNSDLTDKLVPVPVKSVLRGYRVRGGYVVVDFPYSEDWGLRTPPEDDEL